MPKHAYNRPAKKRLVSGRGAVVAGTFAAIACAAFTGTAQAAEPSAAKSAPHAAHTWHHSSAKYTVKKGDTLRGIARAHKTPGGWHAIAWANKIHSPYIIHPGQVLKLPTWGHTEKPAASKASTASTSTTVKAAPVAATTATTASSTSSTAASTAYPDNLNGWINHALAVMKQNGIPGSYDGIYRNTMRESSGNPNAINLWDSNAAAGTPSIGLLQVIQPTFDTYHVPGTSTNIYDPVANLTAACNYAYHVYGSIDNVNGPY
ncbi:LysM peptidoglycan-binding domain-containing protein [Streptomyces sp. V4-01]|uniref:LysM peptidoglycan-binding domain-containing protein n=1 Tax=Actinacidiphila polyblastidii TaxID=3110430 RepID=A0ABU7P3S0_9ACTN|nr:LysM peptidoglycan-binding domain-containing protein [Streptomyces sp. V4-01]